MVCCCAEAQWWLKPGYHLSYMEEVPPYPYQRIRRIDGRDTGVLAIIAPFYDLDYYRVRAPPHTPWLKSLFPSFCCGCFRSAPGHRRALLRPGILPRARTATHPLA